MADLLIKHLKEKGAEHSALSLLVSQWGFDERLIPKALQTISSLFPHYSRHDESHSRQILINIERLLGEEGISLLSATDTWLLLEAAYWHDIGMVVSRKDFLLAMSDNGFEEYIEDICNKPHHELHRFAKEFNQGSEQWFFGADSPMQAVEKFRELMSEWFRRKHSERAVTIINSPMESIGLSSPRTELIPARLFKMLGRICQMHGRSFTEILDPSGLPFKQTGVAQDDCHPRYIACLLRMGDLLDLDDNRFCPVMQCIAGEDRPQLSKAHEEKHSAIRHLRVDRDRIEIKAECASIEGYIETCKWFDWLKLEMHSQMAHWQDIVPSRELGLLPTLGELEVLLVGELQVLEKGRRPQFSIDAAKAFSLIQGTNIYSTSFAYVREILQNAVDASLIRLWLENEADDSIDWTSPRSVHALLEREKIFVELVECEDLKVNASSVWRLKVSDSGTGIGVRDLGYMLRVGASQDNRQRQNVIRNMPDWLKPSGSFGIGLQSIFMVCDLVKINTKDLFSNERLEVVMHSPTSTKEGLVFIKRKPILISEGYGTSVEFEFIIPAPERSPLAYGRPSIKSVVAAGHDPIHDEGYSYEAAGIADSIVEFAGGSLIPIEGVMKTRRHGELPILKASKKTSAFGEFDYLDVDGALVGVSYRFSEERRGGEKFTAFYRGQPFKFDMNLFPLIDVRVNILAGKAGEWLSASRSEVAASARGKLEKLVFSAVEQKFSKDVLRSDGWDDVHEKNMSTFAAVMASRYGGAWESISKELGDKWLDFEVDGQKLRVFFSKNSWLVGSSIGSSYKPDIFCDVFLESRFSYIVPVILAKWLESRRNFITVLSYGELVSESKSQNDEGVKSKKTSSSKALGKGDIWAGVFKDDLKQALFYRLTKTKSEPYTIPALASKLLKLASGVSYNQRFVLNVHASLKPWKDLELAGVLSSNIDYVFPETSGRTAGILLPFLFLKEIGATRKVDSGGLREVSSYVQGRLKKNISISKIEELYVSLISFLDEIMGDSPFSNEWLELRVNSDKN